MSGSVEAGSPSVAERIFTHLKGRRDAMERLLRDVAEMETPTRDPESQQELLTLLEDQLRGCGLATRRIPGWETGGHLYARPEGRPRGRPAQLVLGHCDTVWPAGTLDTMPVERLDGRLRGPGVFDMKGGLVQMIFALKALHELGLEPPVDPAVLVSSDEEVGSPESVRYVKMLARRVCRALILEPALGPEGALKTARRGVANFEIRIRGRGAHVGLDPQQGASAIQELSHVIQRLHAISDEHREVSVNVGEIEGGVRPNVVAAEARAVVDVRVPTREEGERVTRAIRELEAVTPGTSLEVSGRLGRPPMEPTPRNRRLWRAARVLGEEMGISLEEGTSGGASDGNLTSLHTATLDGLGAVGDGAHAVHEYVEIDRMPERSALLALLLMLPAEVTEGDASVDAVARAVARNGGATSERSGSAPAP